MSLQPDPRPDPRGPDPLPPLGPGELGTLAHLYRAEVYRGTVWRTRLDTTTNWSIVTLGLALSLTFAAPDASALPLLLTGVLLLVFLFIEARRYRYFNVWRERSRLMETRFLVPLLEGRGAPADWRAELARDYREPRYPISTLTAVARRVRSNYLYILAVQTLAYAGKLIEHPEPARSLRDVMDRAAVGPIPGWLVLVVLSLYVATWVGLAVWAFTGGAGRDADDDEPEG
ncbi:hypothetical protein Rumeso_02766 [Rubellimicrobium mesophilum DSM 19309]|uniref:DUF2270 domain-containing protein n=1 Tax=Rubellimicrobium mesophilum DSM 19309 TaxID=442562 RepID=A0A017HPI7_9RHOB|nr:DUF2270 domain-containing protein [Rubellimicrobium mesophilum]EYD75679.1 hypothetical protein Rumeso_02766 [Rubellimicrobium mesophilum DSM 19309]